MFKPQPLLSDGSLWISINISHFLQDPDVLFLKLIGFIMFCSSLGKMIFVEKAGYFFLALLYCLNSKMLPKRFSSGPCFRFLALFIVISGRQRLVQREVFSEENWKKVYYLSNGNGAEMRGLVPFMRQST